jgi:hypothetical protein
MKQNTITIITAAEAFDRYKAAYDADLLTQGDWHIEKRWAASCLRFRHPW